LLIKGAQIVTTLSPDNPLVAATRGQVRGTDNSGHVFTTARLPRSSGATNDSSVLLRISRATAHVDTIARLLAVSTRSQTAGANGTFSFSMPTFGTAEEAIPFADGWVAVVRLSPYRVDWLNPNGSWVLGSRLPVASIPMDDREKRDYLQRTADATGAVVKPIESITDWPKEVPLYLSPARLLAAPDGRLLVARMPSADYPGTRYDVINRHGTIDGQLAMPANEKVVSFGSKAAFIVVTDSDGIQKLRRHPWKIR
jgi:hypothetical protein